MFVNDTNDMVEFLMFSRYNNSIQRIEFLEQSLRAHQIRYTLNESYKC